MSAPEATRIIASGLRNGDVPAADKTYLAQLVAARTGISQADAEKRVNDVIAKAKDVELKARQTGRYGAQSGGNGGILYRLRDASLARSSPLSLLRSPVIGATRRWHCSADRWQHLFYPAPLSLLDVDVAGECWVYFECDTSRSLSHLIESGISISAAVCCPLSYSITGPAKASM